MQAGEFLSLMGEYGPRLSMLGAGRQFAVYSHNDLTFVVKAPLPDEKISQITAAIEGYEAGLAFLRGLTPPTSIASAENFAIGSMHHSGPLIIQQKGTVFPEGLTAAMEQHGIDAAAKLILQLAETDRQILLRGLVAFDVSLPNYLILGQSAMMHDLGIVTSPEALRSEYNRFGQFYEQVRNERVGKRGFYQYKRLLHLSMIGPELADIYIDASGLPFRKSVKLDFSDADLSAAAREVMHELSLAFNLHGNPVRNPLEVMRAGLEGKLNDQAMEDLISETVARTKYEGEFQEIGRFELKSLAESPWGEKAEAFIEG